MVAAALLTGTGLVGCASEIETYCGELAAQQPRLTELALEADEPASDVLTQTLDVLGGLRDAAPGDIADEWATLVFAYEGLVEAFEAAGTTPTEFDPASPPEGVAESERKRIIDAAAELRGSRVSQAAEEIEQHARDVCKTDLSITGDGG